MGAGGLFQPGAVLAAGLQIVFQHLPVYHQGDGRLGLLDGQPHVGKGDGLLVRLAGH